MTTFIVCFPATAQNWQSINNEVTFNTSLGWLGGESKEYVYDEGHKVSQLDWKIKNAAIIKGDISWTPVSYITLNARGWTTLASGSGEMEDYDCTGQINLPILIRLLITPMSLILISKVGFLTSPTTALAA